MSMWMWYRFYLLSFAIQVLPLAANCNAICTGHGNRTASSNYEANMRVFMAILPNKTSSMLGRYANHDTGDGMYAVSHCHNGTDFSSCWACITLALQEAQIACPYQKSVEFSNNNCSLKLSAIIYLETVDFLVLKHDGHKEGFSAMRNVSMANENIMALVFQAVGFACLFFLLRQDWHDRKNRSMMHPSDPPSEDK